MARSVAKGTLSISPDVKPETFLTPSYSPTRSVYSSTSPLITASYFFRRALEPRKGRKAEQIDQDYRDAAHLAVLAAPFRHSKLTATKIPGDPNNPARFKDDATADELRAELMKRIVTLQDAGLIDLKALPAPNGGIARPVPGVDQSGIIGE
jgi:hypothetical protein